MYTYNFKSMFSKTNWEEMKPPISVEMMECADLTWVTQEMKDAICQKKKDFYFVSLSERSIYYDQRVMVEDYIFGHMIRFGVKFKIDTKINQLRKQIINGLEEKRKEEEIPFQDQIHLFYTKLNIPHYWDKKDKQIKWTKRAVIEFVNPIYLGMLGKDDHLFYQDFKIKQFNDRDDWFELIDEPFTNALVIDKRCPSNSRRCPTCQQIVTPKEARIRMNFEDGFVYLHPKCQKEYLESERFPILL